jgi:hypothetical protein
LHVLSQHAPRKESRIEWNASGVTHIWHWQLWHICEIHGLKALPGTSSCHWIRQHALRNGILLMANEVVNSHHRGNIWKLPRHRKHWIVGFVAG